MKKNILITGLTSGIGEAIAHKFAKDDYNIIGHYNQNADKAMLIKQALNDKGIDVTLIQADLSADQGAATILNELKSVEVYALINNAGGYIEERHYSELTADFLKQTFMLNTFTPTLLAAGLIEGMKQRGQGHIVNISSIAAKYGSSVNTLPYASSKLALEGMTRTLAREGAPHNVMVNTVRPGIIETDFHKRFPKDLDQRAKMVPMKRVGQPKEVADLVFFLVDQSQFITNEILTVAGGE